MSDLPKGPGQSTDAPSVAVFHSDDAGVLPLAIMALEAEHIEYVIGSPESDRREWSRQGTTPIAGEPVAIFVAADVAARARDLLVDLENPSAVAAAYAGAAPDAPAEGPDAAAIELQDADTGVAVGRITESQLQFLTTHLEQGDQAGQAYYIDAATLQMLEDARAEPALLQRLRGALGDREGMEIRWFVP